MSNATGPSHARTSGLDGDPGLTRAERSARTAYLLASAAECSDPARREALLDEVVVINRKVAEAVASRYRNRGVAIDDLNQVACLGLLRAVRRYDLDRAADLLTYAVPTIRGELQRYFRDHGWTIRPTRRIQELQWRVNQLIEAQAQRLGREPTRAEICADLDLSHEEYAEAVTAFGCFQPSSLDRPATRDDAGVTVGDLVGVEQSVSSAEARVVLRPVLRRLPERDRRILFLRFFEDRTQEEIGQDLGVTQMQVSRLLKRILRDLREAIDEPDDRAAGDP